MIAPRNHGSPRSKVINDVRVDVINDVHDDVIDDEHDDVIHDVHDDVINDVHDDVMPKAAVGNTSAAALSLSPVTESVQVRDVTVALTSGCSNDV